MKAAFHRFLDQSRQADPTALDRNAHLKTMPVDFPEKVEMARKRFQRMGSGDLKEQAVQWSDDVQNESRLVDLVTGFALVKEAVRRVFGYMHYDVQIEAGFYLYLGWVAEMATGEGKTLMTTLPAFARGAEKKGLHVATANAYLAERDYEECQPVFEQLGLTAAFIKDKAALETKMAAYESDIVYGTGYEFGFDYLRSQLRLLEEGRPEYGTAFVERLKGEEHMGPDVVREERSYVIIDEIDSVLIDEGRTPLVISGGKADESPAAGMYRVAKALAVKFEEDEHFEMNEKQRRVSLTDLGREMCYKSVPKKLGHHFKRPWHTYVENALAAQYLFRRDEHYVVDENKVMIVDEYSGRRFEDRTWRNGLHQAVEAKEGVTINDESGTQASITRQRYYRMYDRLCGMTGTGMENRKELKEVYHTDVRKIPLNKPSQRLLLPERIFADEKSKLSAIVREIAEMHTTGRPILIGTRTIIQSEQLGRALEKLGLYYRLLNAKQDKEEAAIVSRAGEYDAITIATNMAGRGTDIKIPQEVEALGGLHVIGFERHESRRVDRQLLGRAGRQGNQGSGRFYSSADDFIINQYAPAMAESWKEMKPEEQGELDSRLSKDLDALQLKIEEIHTRQRLELLSKDQWLEELRKKI